MKAIQSDVQTFLEGSKQFVLPLYQRRYSWAAKHWTTLERDLDRLMREPERRSHFIGSFVTAALDHAADQSVSRYRLIDGQQRLTTLLLLLAALRDAAFAQGDSGLADEIHGLYLTNQFKKGDAARKLIPTGEDQAAFAACLDRPAAPQGRVGEAYRFFADVFARVPAARLADARRAALGRLTVVSITLEADDDAHLIFESLNAKGERLTQADLLRNYFLMRLPQAAADTHFARLWQPMQADLGEDLTSFFRHYLMRDAEGAEVRKDEVYEHVKDRVDALAASPADVVGELEVVRRHAGHYARLVAPKTHELDREVADRIDRLHRLKSTTAYPFLLVVMDRIASGSLPPDVLPATLDLIESFLIRRLVCSVPTNQLRVIFRGLCRAAADAPDAMLLLRAIRSTLAYNQRCPTDAAFRDAIARRPLYGGSKRDAARYLLERIERSYGHKEGPDPSADGVQVEHVMPQTLTDAWRAALASDVDPAAADEAHGLWLHTLGNLTLTAYNATLSNAPFAAKRVHYLDSKFTLNQHFAAADVWNAAAIQARGEMLAEQATSIWPDVAEHRAGAVDVASRAKATRVSGVVVDGTRYAVDTMVDAAHHVFRHLHAYDAARYETALAKTMKPHRRAPTAATLRTPREVAGTFIDLHGSTIALKMRCRRLVTNMGLQRSIVTFDTTEPSGAS